MIILIDVLSSRVTFPMVTGDRYNILYSSTVSVGLMSHRIFFELSLMKYQCNLAL